MTWTPGNDSSFVVSLQPGVRAELFVVGPQGRSATEILRDTIVVFPPDVRLTYRLTCDSGYTDPSPMVNDAFANDSGTITTTREGFLWSSPSPRVALPADADTLRVMYTDLVSATNQRPGYRAILSYLKTLSAHYPADSIDAFNDRARTMSATVQQDIALGTVLDTLSGVPSNWRTASPGRPQSEHLDAPRPRTP